MTLGYYDLTFSPGPLGMQLSELSPSTGSSVATVTKVTDHGQALALGVVEGDEVCGLEGRAAISYAYVVAAVKGRLGDVRVRMLRKK